MQNHRWDTCIFCILFGSLYQLCANAIAAVSLADAAVVKIQVCFLLVVFLYRQVGNDTSF